MPETRMDEASAPDGKDRRLRCACGWEARGTQEQVVAAAVEHGRRFHNMEPTTDQVTAMIVPD